MRLNEIKSRGSSQRGGALIGATFVVLMMATLSMCFLQVSASASKERRQLSDNKLAFYMAEAGLAEAVNGIAIGKSGKVGTPDLPAAFGGGLFWVEARELPDQRVALKSTGLCRAGRKTLEVVVAKNNEPLPALGAFGDEEVVLEDGASIELTPDPNDDDDGSGEPLGGPGVGLGQPGQSLGGPTGQFGPGLNLTPTVTSPGAQQPPPPPPVVGSNGDIILHDDAEILGDAVPGVNGIVDLSQGSTVSGSSAPRAGTVGLPGIVVPEIASTGDYTVTSSSPLTLSSGDHHLGNLILDPSASLTLLGPMNIVVDALQVGPEGTVTVDGTGGAVVIYALHSIQIDGSASLDTVGTDSNAVALLITANNIDPGLPLAAPEIVALDGGGTFYGFIYAPRAAVVIPSGFELFGGVAARRLTLASGATVQVDSDMDPPGEILGALPEIVSWRIEELPQGNPLVNSRRDPLAILAEQGYQPPDASQAHELADDAHSTGNHDVANFLVGP